MACRDEGKAWNALHRPARLSALLLTQHGLQQIGRRGTRPQGCVEASKETLNRF